MSRPTAYHPDDYIGPKLCKYHSIIHSRRTVIQALLGLVQICTCKLQKKILWLIHLTFLYLIHRSQWINVPVLPLLQIVAIHLHIHKNAAHFNFFTAVYWDISEPALGILLSSSLILVLSMGQTDKISSNLRQCIMFSTPERWIDWINPLWPI